MTVALSSTVSFEDVDYMETWDLVTKLLAPLLEIIIFMYLL